jgi:hypothetical protein
MSDEGVEIDIGIREWKHDGQTIFTVRKKGGAPWDAFSIEMGRQIMMYPFSEETPEGDIQPIIRGLIIGTASIIYALYGNKIFVGDEELDKFASVYVKMVKESIMEKKAGQQNRDRHLN